MEKKSAVVMEGGAMRGMFTCGVLDVFMENGITFDAGIGISAGAVFGCNYKSGQIGRPIRYNKKYCNDKRYCSFKSLIKTGDMYGVDFCYRELPYELDPFDWDAYKKNPMKFYIGATNAETGEPEYYLCTGDEERDLKWMQASASMPVVSKVVEVDGLKMLDGGMIDAVPFKCMESLGYNNNVIILTQAKGYRKSQTRILPMAKITLRKYPKMVEVLRDRHIMYNKQMDELDQIEESGKSIVVRPPEPLGVSRTEKNPDELERIYQIGRKVAEERHDEIKEFLNKDTHEND